MPNNTPNVSDAQRKEKLFLEAVRGYLSSDDAKLGLASHSDADETSHLQWHQWENIDDMFALKAAESPYMENMTGAFYQVHSYKWIEDPTFAVALEKELAAQGVPSEWKAKAVKYVEEIYEELKGENPAWSERDAGWNPQIDELVDMTKNADRRDPDTSETFTGGGPAPQEGEIE